MRVVVGVDRSPASFAALDIALREAATHDAELVVVHAWQTPFEVVHETETSHTLRVAARDAAEDVLRELVDPLQHPRVTAVALEGEPADVLTAATRAGDLLVVGAHRRGLLQRVLRGSVSSTVVRQARGPVVVVPERAGRRRGSSGPPAREGRLALSGAR